MQKETIIDDLKNSIEEKKLELEYVRLSKEIHDTSMTTVDVKDMNFIIAARKQDLEYEKLDAEIRSLKQGTPSSSNSVIYIWLLVLTVYLIMN